MTRLRSCTGLLAGAVLLGAIAWMATGCSATVSSQSVDPSAHDGPKLAPPIWPSDLSGKILIEEDRVEYDPDVEALSEPFGYSVLKMLDIDGGTVEQIDFMASELFAAKWRPDGAGILIARPQSLEHDTRFFNLTPGQPLEPVDLPSAYVSFAWGPDCNSVVLNRPNAGVWIHRLDGAAATLIDNRADGFNRVSWSEDGHKIAYVVSSSDQSFNNGIWVANPDGSEQTFVVPDPSGDLVYAPQLSPDASQLVFVRHQTGRGQVMSYSFETGLTEQLTDNPDSSAWWPHFSPDGAWIAFSNPDGISVMRPDGSDEQQVLHLEDARVLDWGNPDEPRCPS